MAVGLNEFCDLVIKKNLEIKEGVFLTCSEQINISVYAKGEEVHIDFGAPYVFLHITGLGPITLFTKVRPRVLGVLITKDTITLKLKGFPDFTVEREDK